jgi:hypothetical protein
LNGRGKRGAIGRMVTRRAGIRNAIRACLSRDLPVIASVVRIRHADRSGRFACSRDRSHRVLPAICEDLRGFA